MGINIEALCAAPPEAPPHSPSQMPLSCPVAPDRPKLIELLATKPSPTPTRAEEDIATTPGCGPEGYSGHQAFAHADTHRGAHRHDAGLWTCRPPRLYPRRHAEHLAGLKIVRHPRPHPPAREEAARVGLKGCAWDHTCASWCSRLPALRFNGRRWGFCRAALR